MGNAESRELPQTPDVTRYDLDEADRVRRVPSDAREGGDGEGEEVGYWQMAKQGYQELVHAIIRPPRAQYSISDLGPTSFAFMGKKFKRTDFQLLNPRGNRLMCSHWEPDGWSNAEQVPCLVYLHGNSSARVEALGQLSLCLSLGISMMAFDCSAGSGKSDGEWVSLGYYERDDLDSVVNYLRGTHSVSTIALWGRSMGAATSLLHGDRDPSIAAMVLDSAFTDLTHLAEEMVEKGREQGLNVPGIVVKIALRMIRGTVQKTAGFNIKDLSPISHADRTFIPAMFVAGKGDDFIGPHHSEMIHGAYAGDKNIVLVDGDHNSPRPRFLYDSVYIFLQNYLQVPFEWALDGGSRYIGLPPWSQAETGAGTRHQEVTLEEYMAMDQQIDVGMNMERQSEFQQALFQVFAQQKDGGGGGAGLSGGKGTNCGDTSSSDGSAEAAAGEEAEAAPLADATKQRKRRPVRKEVQGDEVSRHQGGQQADVFDNEGGIGAELKGGGENLSPDAAAFREWACSQCTYVNDGISPMCVVCEGPGPNDKISS
ncbi:unnamed protein product [Chrysoparadoxa australica]